MTTENPSPSDAGTTSPTDRAEAHLLLRGGHTESIAGPRERIDELVSKWQRSEVEGVSSASLRFPEKTLYVRGDDIVAIIR